MSTESKEVSVIGLGYVGLPLAVQAASRGYRVHAVDTSEALLETLRSGRNPLVGDPVLDERFGGVSLDLRSAPPACPIHIVCVPTPVVRRTNPDLSFVEAATRSIARVLRDDDLVIIESTVYPGVCDEVVAPILMETGRRFGLAHCPERINPGDPRWHVGNIPRVVGANDPDTLARSVAFYRSIIDAEVTPLSQTKAAEATKIMENTFRDVNIAFVNEMAQSFQRLGIDVSEVIRGAATKPFGFLPHYPGVGVGGHCIAVDPYYMIEKGKEVGFNHDFLALARRINAGMPRYTADLVQQGLNRIQRAVNGSTIAVLGLSYKPGVADTRESPSFDLIAELTAMGANVRRFDPFLPGLSDVATLAEALHGADAVVLATAHDEFVKSTLQIAAVGVVIDGRNALRRDVVVSHGAVYVGVGVPIQ